MYCAWLRYILNVNNVEIEVGPDSRQVTQQQQFLETDFAFVQTSRDIYAFCTVYRCDINISHVGQNDITQHVKFSKHAQNSKAVESCAIKNTPKISKYPLTLLARQKTLT